MIVLKRPLGRTGESVSVLGFGLMRLPVIDGRMDQIDVQAAGDMLRYAIDHGVNYFDTAYPYHAGSPDGPGASESFLGQVLSQGDYRQRVLVATKLPGWLVNSRADMDRILEGQLERLQSDYVDCYLLHGIDASMWKKLYDLDVLGFLDAAKGDGRIRFAGFSYHDAAEHFAPIVDAYEWDFCQIQYNYMDIDFQAGEAGLAYAAEKGLGIVIMEPLKGGRLARNPPAAVQAVWDSAPVKRTPVEWALRFLWDDPRISVVLSGMSTMDQVVENVRYAEEGFPNSLSVEEKELIARARELYRQRTLVDCTGCRYCMPCPQGIEIPLVFRIFNDSALYESLDNERFEYRLSVLLGRTAAATSCVECGQCEAACPQKLAVVKELARAAEALEVEPLETPAQLASEGAQ
ncbi:MAG: aldo/keto reductase [Thermoleophilia bacterium]|nr:aldo/keto reductase [Thermoleophilia bacterium]